MKDLDFDELDKAVNSLMQGGLKPTDEGQAAAATASNDADDSVTETEATNQPAAMDTTPVVKEETVTAMVASPAMPTVAVAPVQPTASLAPKRSGRFMDVMHPSSDMRPPLSMPARVGKEIAPVSSNVTPAASTIEPTAEVSAFDPIKADSTPQTGEVVDEHVAEIASDAISTPDEIDMMTPDQLGAPTSPFLSDAKVEKRPLGGSAPALSETESVSTAESVEDIDQVLASPQPESPEVPVPLPVELSGDVVSIESDATSHAVTMNQSEASPIGTAVAGSSSIAQQYKEKENSGDHSHAPIYDTNVQPLTHPAKKKSGWGAVLWILLIILICVGIATALYFVGIIRLPM